MRVSFAGAGFSASPGDVVERPDDEARRLIERGYALPAESAEAPVERAVPAPVAVETRAPTRRRGKR